MGEKVEQEMTKSYWWPEQSDIELKDVGVSYRNFISINLNFSIFVLIPLGCLLVFLSHEYLFEAWLYFVEVFNRLSSEHNLYEFSFFVAITTFAVWYISKPKGVYLMDFAVWPGKKDWELPNEGFVTMSRNSGFFSAESIDFQEKMSKRTGLGDQTYLPPGPKLCIQSKPPETTMVKAREEAAEVIFSILDTLFANTKLKPSQIDILVVNCSLFCPTPSIASMIVNHYKMRSNIISFNLGGMGCSAGVIAIDLAKDLLQVHKNSNALVVSTENITLNWYQGNEKGMLLQNALFRCGGAAMMLSNRWIDSWNAKYQLVHTVRVHKGASDSAYHSVYQEEDKENRKGVRLSRDLMNIVGEALKSNMTELGPLVLPWMEQIKFFKSFILARIFKQLGKKTSSNLCPRFQKGIPAFLYPCRRTSHY